MILKIGFSSIIIQTLRDLGVKISCLAFRLGNNTVYLPTQGMSQCNQFSEEDHGTHTYGVHCAEIQEIWYTTSCPAE